MRREMRYKLLKDGSIAESGAGETVDLGSGGVGFSIERELTGARGRETRVHR